VGQALEPSGGCSPSLRVAGVPFPVAPVPNLSRVRGSSRNSQGLNPSAVDHLTGERHPKLQAFEVRVFAEEAAGAAEQRETMDVGVPFPGHGHDRVRVDAPCLLNDHVHARPQEVAQVLDPAEVP
jgi:hypothetical protein